MSSPSPRAVASAYRTLAQLIRRLPHQQRAGARNQLRGDFRKNAGAAVETIPALLEVADKKIAFLRIITPKDQNRDGVQKGTSKFVYSDTGELDENGKARVVTKARVSNWTGSNMDPCSVKRHNVGLQRAGFQNNTHAKGMF